jgi:hypothetical protein
VKEGKVMPDELPDNIRESLHAVLFYMIESEAKSHYQNMEEDGVGYDTYEHVRDLVQHFGLEDLVELDQAYRDSVFLAHAPELEE